MKTRMRLLGVASVAFFLSIGGLAGQPLSSYVRTDKPEAVIEIRAGQQSLVPDSANGIWDLHRERRQRDLWGRVGPAFGEPKPGGLPRQFAGDEHPVCRSGFRRVAQRRIATALAALERCREAV